MSNISNLEDYRAPTPSIENSKVLPNPPKYKQAREREYLTSSEIDRASTAAKSIGRHGHRGNATLRIWEEKQTYADLFLLIFALLKAL